MSNRILVVTSCTGEKKYKPENQLIFEDFANKSVLVNRESELVNYQTTAGEMYTGSQHHALMKGIAEYRNNGGDIDLCVISAGYGLLNEESMICPYEATFNLMNSHKIKKWSHELEITRDLQEKITGYDLVFFLLGDKYLQSVEWPLQLNENQQAIFFAGNSSKSKILNWDNYHVLTIGEREAKEFKFGLIGIKGYLFAQLLTSIVSEGMDTWDNIKENPKQTRELIFNALSNKSMQLNLFTDLDKEKNLLMFYSELFPVTDDMIAINFKQEPMFFIPENDDRVDPNYDFKNDQSLKNRNPLDDHYAHQFFDVPQYDGVLVSKVNIDGSTKQKLARMNELSDMHKFYRLEKKYPIMGDCGAFSYIGDVEPPYTTQEIINYYHNFGFDYGVSIDHLIVGNFKKDEDLRNKRYNLTLNMAEEFLQMYNNNKDTQRYRFHPIGIVQGWDPESYRVAVRKLIEMGYDYIAIGGLAKEKSERIYEILKEVSKEIIDPTFRMHLFGVARDIRTMKAYHKLGVTSFDSSSPLRRAWLGTEHNYHTVEGKHYAAIRIPEAKESTGRVKQMIEQNDGLIDISEYKRLEQEALTAMRSFNAGVLELDETLDAILDYDVILGDNRESHESLYEELLTEKPWESCDCAICRKIGIEVVVFRGNNRNRRRGFHNTFVYYTQLQELKKHWKK